MKQFFVSLFCFVCLAFISSQAAIIEVPEATAGMIIRKVGGDGCPAGTYMSGWNGDHSSGVLFACIDSGASTREGTNTGADVDSTGIEWDAFDERVIWVPSSDDMVDDASGTLCLKIIVYSDGTDHTMSVAELWDDTNSYYSYFQIQADEDIANTWQAATADNHEYGSIVRDGSTINEIALTWDASQSAVDHCLSVNGGNSFDCADDIDVIGSDFEEIVIGNFHRSGAGADRFKVTEWYILAGYKTDCGFD
jgi:hypothetical protein